MRVCFALQEAFMLLLLLLLLFFLCQYDTRNTYIYRYIISKYTLLSRPLSVWNACINYRAYKSKAWTWRLNDNNLDPRGGIVVSFFAMLCPSPSSVEKRMHMLLTLWTPDNLHAAGIFREGLSSGSASGANRSSSARSSAASSARSSSSAANSGTSSHTRSCGICQIHSSVWWREWESESDATWKIQITPIELASSLQLCVSDRVVGWQCGAWALWRPQLPYLLQM